MTNGRKIHWDTCPLIAWLTDEPTRSAEEKAGLDEVADQFERSECLIVMSSLYRVEVLPMAPDQRQKLELFTKRRSFQEIAVSPAILELAREIREFYAKERISVKTPDAIHLATAINCKVDVFHTFDGGRKRGLLDLDGNVAGHHLSVKAPFVPQGRLL